MLGRFGEPQLHRWTPVVWMRHEAEGNDPHNDREDECDFFQKLIHGICVTVWERVEHLIRR